MPRVAASTEKKITALLKRQALSVTESRKRILQYFLDQPGALSHGDIEKKAGTTFDRVTIYRTLQTFVDRGLIHTSPSADNAVRYALCKDECGDGHHRHEHIHFVCQQCHHTFCLDEVVTPVLKLPKGYSPRQVEVLVQGKCKDCTETAKK
jgi:Fur family ferric uptake transcriptional regulator